MPNQKRFDKRCRFKRDLLKIDQWEVILHRHCPIGVALTQTFMELATSSPSFIFCILSVIESLLTGGSRNVTSKYNKVCFLHYNNNNNHYHSLKKTKARITQYWAFLQLCEERISQSYDTLPVLASLPSRCNKI